MHFKNSESNVDQITIYSIMHFHFHQKWLNPNTKVNSKSTKSENTIVT